MKKGANKRFPKKGEGQIITLAAPLFQNVIIWLKIIIIIFPCISIIIKFKILKNY